MTFLFFCLALTVDPVRLSGLGYSGIPFCCSIALYPNLLDRRPFRHPSGCLGFFPPIRHMHCPVIGSIFFHKIPVLFRNNTSGGQNYWLLVRFWHGLRRKKPSYIPTRNCP